MSKGQLPRWVDYGLLPALNLIAAFIVSGLVVVVIGEDPFEAVKWLVWGALGYGEGIGYTLYYATNFIFTGLAVAVAFHAGLFNIGGEGQAYVAVWVSLWSVLPWTVSFHGGSHSRLQSQAARSSAQPGHSSQHICRQSADPTSLLRQSCSTSSHPR